MVRILDTRQTTC